MAKQMCCQSPAVNWFQGQEEEQAAPPHMGTGGRRDRHLQHLPPANPPVHPLLSGYVVACHLVPGGSERRGELWGEDISSEFVPEAGVGISAVNCSHGLLEGKGGS